MNKKFFVLAVFSALAVASTAQADTANVEVYGKLYPEVVRADTSGASTTAASDLTQTLGADAESTLFVQSSNSNIGFAGDIDVGGGLTGWFQVEQAIGLSDDEPGFSNRNSAVGLTGGFGNVFLGTWDTVYKQLGGAVSFLGLTSGNFPSNSNVFSRVGFGDSNRRTRFHERPKNYIQYDTPEFGGFQFLVGYSPDEAKTATQDSALTSFGGKYEAGPLYVALAHEIHDDFIDDRRGSGGIDEAAAAIGTTATNSKDTATRFTIGYAITENTDIGADFATMEWEVSGGAAGEFQRYEKDAWAITVRHKMGKTSFAAQYTNSDEGSCALVGGGACSTNGLDATQISLGVLHSFDRRLGIFALYSQIDNGAGANFSNVDLVVAPGADTQAFGAGVLLRF